MVKLFISVRGIITSKYITRYLKTRLSSSSAIRSEIFIPTLYGNIGGILWSPKNSINNASRRNKHSDVIPVVCLHGIGDNSESFSPLITQLIENYHLNQTFLSLDLPGHGRSYHNKTNYYEFFVEGALVVLRAMKHFGWDKVTLLGHSLGAGLAFGFAGTFPEHVHKYAAFDHLRPHAFHELTDRYRKVVSSVLKIESSLLSNKGRVQYTYEQILEKFYTSRGGELTMEGCKTLLPRGVTEGPDNLFKFNHDVVTKVRISPILSETQLELFGRRITCPICVIKAIPGQELEPLKNFEKYIENLRSSNPGPIEYHKLPGTHYIHLNSPQLVAPIINKFFQN